jgi:hypothetical protein
MHSGELPSDERVFLERWVGDTRANAFGRKSKQGCIKSMENLPTASKDP